MGKVISLLGTFLVFLMILIGAAWLTLRLTTSEKTVSVPDLQGTNVVDALKTVGAVGLDLRVVREEYSADAPRNIIITQYPKAGTVLKIDRNVEVVLSLGARDVPIPDVVGMPLRRAELVLKEHGLYPGRFTRVYSESVESQHVMAQNPMALARNVEGNTVDLLVSLGQRPLEYRMPDLIGEGFARAVALLESVDLTIGKVTYEEYAGLPEDRVINQSPPFGSPVNRDKTISFVVSRGTAAPTGTTVTRIPFRFRIPFGLLPVDVGVFVEDQEGRRQVFSGRRFPGSVIETTLEIQGKGVVEVFLNGKPVQSRQFQ
ncbi:MAG: PASTA domain-containing protein [bacterium]|nr:PASTA domain-containing protein [bacterium]